jgi:hypothetical protein
MGSKAAALTLALLAGRAIAQAPDVTIKLDARLNYRSAENDATTQRLYDSLGEFSIVSIAFKLEPGFRVFASQKLQRFDGGRDPEFLDEYYIEDEGIWRVGKQHLPFGSGRLVRESALAARGDTNLILEGLPIAAAYVQGGSGRQKGAVGRIGGRLGVSLFYGDHFGIDGASVALIRKPEDALGNGRGYRNAFGVDYSKGIGDFNLAVEAVAYRSPNTDLDKPFDILDFRALYTPSKYHNYFVGWTRRTNPTADMWRIGASVFLTRNIYLEPLVRYRNGEIFDFNVAIRVKL